MNITAAVPVNIYARSLILTIPVLLFLMCSGPEDSSSFSSVYNQYGEPMLNVPETADILMYEVNLRAFSVGGGLQGIMEGLDHLDSMHVNVIWLMPVYPEGELKSVNSPYCIRDYKTVGGEYGDLQDLRELTTEAHKRGMAVILDWVANHTAWDHPWISDHPEWYTQDADGNIISPAGTNWYDVADLNYSDNSMRNAMIDAMEYWILEANTDGYRCDHADGVPADFWKQALTRLNSIPGRDLIFLAEGAERDLFSAGFQMIYSWNYYNSLIRVAEGSDAAELFAAHYEDYRALGEGYEYLRYSTNHDQSAWDATPVQIFGGTDAALAYAAVTLFSGGIPMIYTGQEVGREAPLSFFRRDPVNWSANPEMRREFYRITDIYAGSETARLGRSNDFSNDAMSIQLKSLDGDTLLIAANLRGSSQTRTLDPALWNSSWTDLSDGGTATIESRLTLEDYEILFLKK